MDPISTAFIAALAKLSEPVIKDSYDALKNLVASKFGKNHNVVSAIEDAEKNLDSAGRKEILREEIEKSGAANDDEIVKAAQALIEKIKLQPDGQQVIHQTVSGDHNIFSATGNVTVHKK
jgi:hypothetical protein